MVGVGATLIQNGLIQILNTRTQHGNKYEGKIGKKNLDSTLELDITEVGKRVKVVKLDE